MHLNLQELRMLDLSGLVPKPWRKKAKAVVSLALAGVGVLVSFAILSPDQGGQYTAIAFAVLNTIGVHQTTNDE